MVRDEDVAGCDSAWPFGKGKGKMGEQRNQNDSKLTHGNLLARNFCCTA
jgi:hypothetical protein